MTLIHGGQLEEIAAQYKIPKTDWLDLSTGIAPTSYPIPEIPLSTWQNLPQQSPELVNAAKKYYQCSELIITNGSQAIIKALPALYQKRNSQSKDVYLPERGYKEHAQAWKLAGYKLHYYQQSLPDITNLIPNSVLVIINPNNPTGCFFDRKILSKYHQALTNLDGLLVVDEAFIDVMPTEQSYCSQVNNNHCLVFRSFGKFFGLAGIRIGFLIANKQWCQTFTNLLGPWQVNGPAQIIALDALKNTLWHENQRNTLRKLKRNQEAMLKQVFSEKLLKKITGCDLFLTLEFHSKSTAKKLYHLLCQQGVYCRLSDEEDTLRFGITTKVAFERLAYSIRHACERLTFNDKE